MVEELEAIQEKKEVKEVQKKIIEVHEPVISAPATATKEELMNLLRLVAPGTNIRTALEGIVKIGKGALLVVENEYTDEIQDGGFKLNCRFTPQRLMELSKMDGAITLSRDMKKIMSCNVLLTPNSKISTSETGTRHKAAERTAKMTGTLVIAVSERKNEINIYYKNIKYHLKNSEEVMRKTQFTLHMLEKQRELFDSNLKRLTEYELQNHPNLEQVCKVIQNGEQMRRMFESLEQNVIELGNEGKTIKSRLREIMKNVGDELMLVIKDYTKLNARKTQNLLDALTFEEILDDINILTALAQKEASAPESIKGWRILSKTGITEQESSLLIRELGNLQNILKESDERYEQIVGAEKMRIFARAATKLRNDAKIEG